MRHRRKTVKLQRDTSHKKALLSNLVVSLIEHSKVKTTLAKAKAVRPFAEKMVTIGKKGSVHARRLAKGYLHSDVAVSRLFNTIAPASLERAGGYTRITKLGQRLTDSAPMALIEWVDVKPEEKKAKATAAAAEPAAAPAAEGAAAAE